MSKLILFNDNQVILTDDNDFIAADLLSQDVVIEQLNLTNLIFDSEVLTNYSTAHVPSELVPDLLASYNFKLRTIRSLLLTTELHNDQGKLKLITRAKQLAHWADDHKFCGRCGAQTISSPREHAKICQQCGAQYYPRLSPCILVAITNGPNILLGRSAHFPAGVYSLLAGFVEVGESAEDTVHREVFEEVKVNIKNLKYFGSQSWPFPHSLMLAYTAEYDSGEIVVDTNELEDARWFNLKTLKTCPELLPAKGSLSRMVLDNLIYHD